MSDSAGGAEAAPCVTTTSALEAAHSAALHAEDEAQAEQVRKVNLAAEATMSADMGNLSALLPRPRIVATLFLSPASLAALECASRSLQQLAELSMVQQASMLGVSVPARMLGESSASLLRFVRARRLRANQGKLAADSGRSAVITPSGRLYTSGCGFPGHFPGVGYDDADAAVGSFSSMHGYIPVAQPESLRDYFRAAMPGCGEPEQPGCCAPTRVLAGLRDVQVASVAVTSDRAAFTTADGLMFTWGGKVFGSRNNGSLILGHGEGVTAYLPRQIEALVGSFVVGCAMSDSRHQVTAAFTDDGTLFTWGDGYGVGAAVGVGFGAPVGAAVGAALLAPPTSWSMMGYPATHDQHLPKRVEALVGVTAVDIGGEHMVIVAQQTPYTCGRSGAHEWEEGRLGHVSPHGGTRQTAFPDADIPRAVQSLTEKVVVAIAAGVRHTAFVTDDGLVYTCGFSCDTAIGGLGHASPDPTLYLAEPKLVEGLVGHRVISVSITCYTTAVVT
jgi:hypothetical protein